MKKCQRLYYSKSVIVRILIQNLLIKYLAEKEDVHANAVHHGFCKRIEDWPHSSYHALISNAPTLLKRTELLNWFGGAEAFIRFHKQPVELKLKEE